jgi:hypothetical protein
MSRNNRDKGRIHGLFVPLLHQTLDSAAWRAMSHGARSLFIALRRQYNVNNHNNGRLWRSYRDAAKEIGSSSEQIARWFLELQHFGFIVQTAPGCLGVDGKGIAPRWRLTDLGTRVGGVFEPPTVDFMKWDGRRFSKNNPSKFQKKQNPAAENRSAPLRKTAAVALRKTAALKGTSAAENRSIYEGSSAAENRYILSIPYTRPSRRSLLRASLGSATKH